MNSNPSHPANEHPAIDKLKRAIDQVSSIILGKNIAIKKAFACLLANGHLLIEDLPGLGKTTLAHSLAVSLDASFHRLQFTSDLLPSDILGVSIFNRANKIFEFHPGPIFADVVLVDEINRATPKTQSALLEAMAERQITVDGSTHPLADNFFVIATQNPTDLSGTFALPDSQLDRFCLKISIGYPDPSAEKELLTGVNRNQLLQRMKPELDSRSLTQLQGCVNEVHASLAIIDYIHALLDFSRRDSMYRIGLSPRAGLALLACSKAWALIGGRNYCIPEDVQTMLPDLATHRLKSPLTLNTSEDERVAHLLKSVAVP